MTGPIVLAIEGELAVGRRFWKAEVVIAPDGKSRLTTTIGRNAAGVAINHKQFWDRQ